MDACAWFRDNHNAEVWLWLSLLCLTSATARVPEGAQSLEQALVLVRAGWAPCTPTPRGLLPCCVAVCCWELRRRFVGCRFSPCAWAVAGDRAL